MPSFTPNDAIVYIVRCDAGTFYCDTGTFCCDAGTFCCDAAAKNCDATVLLCDAEHVDVVTTDGRNDIIGVIVESYYC